jgi:hypothetical protein
VSLYTDGTNRWPYRAPVAIDNTAGSASATDVSIVVPKDWDLFWKYINQTDGRDIRVCDADGWTVLTYQLTSLNIATRTLTIEVDGYAMPAQAMCQIWIYWGATGVSSLAGSFVAAGAVNGYVLQSGPIGPVVPAIRENFRAVRPRSTVQKSTGESLYLTFDLRGALTTRPKGQPFGGGLEFAEIDYVSYRVLTGGSVPMTPLSSTTKPRFLDGMVVVYITGGTVDTEYTIELTVVTTDGQTLLFFAWLSVRNPDEA